MRLEPLLPPACTAAEVARKLDAHCRRRRRRARLVVVKHPHRAPGRRYALEARALERLRPPAPGDFNPRTLPQQDPAAVRAAIELVAAEAGESAAFVAEMVLGALECTPRTMPAAMTPGRLPVPSPLNADVVQSLVSAAGIPGDWGAQVRNGFDALYCGGKQHLWTRNSVLAPAESDFLVAELAKEVALGNMMRVTPLYTACPLLPAIQCAIAVVPKDGAGHRLITNASGPVGCGTNWHVHPAAVTPCRMDTAAGFGEQLCALREQLGPAAAILLKPYDVSAAYRTLGLRTQDLWLHVLSFNGELYAPRRGQFGARAHGYYLCGITWSLAQRLVREKRAAAGVFVDDSILGAAAEDFADVAACFVALCKAAGLPLNLVKLALAGEPATVAVWIGLLWDSVAMTVALPAAKLASITAAVIAVAGRSRVRCDELQSVLGQVNFASQVVAVLGACMASVRACLRGCSGRQWVSLTPAARLEMQCWPAVMQEHNGVALLRRRVVAADAVTTTSDASHIGFGWACPATGQYASELWPPEVKACQPDGLHINPLELVAGVLAMAAVGSSAAGQRAGAVRGVKLFSDNTATVANLSTLRARSVALSRFTRTAAVIASRLGFLPLSEHVQGVDNVTDPLSRGVIPSLYLGPEWTRVRYSQQQLVSLLTCATPWSVENSSLVMPLPGGNGAGAARL